jgi:HTH-type transcriptional regulator, sugar sensing transcriptional regulator
MFEQFLEEIGLSEKEAKIYLALLQVDSDAIPDIAKKTGINRTTVYPVLESLQKKGLVSEVQEGKKVSYVAAPPERLETYVERQRVLFEEKSKRLKDVIPQIKSIQRESGERPIVKYFEGRDGAISAYEEFYEMHNTETREGYFLYNRDLLDAQFTDSEREKFSKIRIGKKVQPVSVYTKKDGEYPFTSQGKRVRIDGEKYPITADITIIEDRVIATTLGEHPVSILIKSKDIAESLASLIRYINDLTEQKH